MITPELLRSWSPCEDGYRRFCELFPKGADLKTAMDGLIADNHDEWAYWLFCASRDRKLFPEIVSLGYMNSGDRNSGDRNSGNWNSGDRNSGNWNSGDRNSGDWNSGDRNSGDWNSGDRNSGNWNSGDRNSGYMNSDTPKTVRVFGKECPIADWDNAYKPLFLWFDTTYWVSESEMTEAEKTADPGSHYRGGQLRKRDYKEAFQLSWDNADKKDREKVRELPNFCAETFFKISGIDLREAS